MNKPKKDSIAGRIVEFIDGTNRKGIVAPKDQKKKFPGKEKGKVLVRMIDPKTFKPLDERKRIVHVENLKGIGFID